MALAYDNSSSDFVAPGTSLSFNLTVGTGDNRILIIGVAIEQGALDLISSVAFNGDAATLIDKRTNTGRGAIYLYQLVNPDSGTHAVTIAWDGSSRTCRGMAASYTGALQTGQPDSKNKGQADGVTSFSQATTVVASGCWLVGIFGASGDTITAGTGTTVRQNPADYRCLADSNGVVGTGSQSLAINCGESNAHAIVASFAPASGLKAVSGVASGSIKTISGVAIASVKKVAGVA